MTKVNTKYFLKIQKIKRSLKISLYPRLVGGSSHFSSESRKEGGNMDKKKPKDLILKYPEASVQKDKIAIAIDL